MHQLTIFGILFLLVFSVLVINYTILKDNSFASGLQYSNEQKHPTINVTKFMSIAENSTEFKDKVNGYAHYLLMTVIITPKPYHPQNPGNTTLEYNLVYALYKNDNDCPYVKVLVITLNMQLNVIDISEYSSYGVPAGYPLPGTCLLGLMPWKVKMDYNGLASTIPWIPPLEQLNYGILAKNVSCNKGQILVLKAEDGSPACMLPNTSKILIERGWAKPVQS